MTESKDQISVDDIKRWGLRAVNSHKSQNIVSGSYYIVELPKDAVIVDENGKVMAQASQDKTMGFCKTDADNAGVENKEAFFVGIPEVPTLADVNTWNERDRNVSPEEKKLLNAYVDRVAPIGSDSEELQQTRKSNLYDGLIKDKEWFDRVIKTEKELASRNSDKMQDYLITQRRGHGSR